MTDDLNAMCGKDINHIYPLLIKTGILRKGTRLSSPIDASVVNEAAKINNPPLPDLVDERTNELRSKPWFVSGYFVFKFVLCLAMFISAIGVIWFGLHVSFPAHVPAPPKLGD